MGQRNEAEVGGDTRDINACRVDECNGDVSTVYPFVKFSKGKNEAASCRDYFRVADRSGVTSFYVSPQHNTL
jgi:hypothetical protein